MNFWDTTHSKSYIEDDFEGSRYNYSDWVMYEFMRAGHRKNGATHKVLRYNAGDVNQYYEGDGISILSPSTSLQSGSDVEGRRNNLSYVVCVEHAGRRVMLPGDAESMAWDSVLTNVSTSELRCDVLKAAHHGRESGFHEDAVDAMGASVVICSVGKEPKTDASDEYESLGANVLSTRDHGTVHLRIWDAGDIYIYDHNDSLIAEL